MEREVFLFKMQFRKIADKSLFFCEKFNFALTPAQTRCIFVSYNQLPNTIATSRGRSNYLPLRRFANTSVVNCPLSVVMYTSVNGKNCPGEVY